MFSSLISWSLTSSTEESSTLELRKSSSQLWPESSSSKQAPLPSTRSVVQNPGYALVRRRCTNLISGSFRCISWRRFSFPLPSSTGSRSYCGPYPGSTREPTECMRVLQRYGKWCRGSLVVTHFRFGSNTFFVY